MQFYFIRHGQSYNNALWSKIGTNEGRKQDPELTDIGWQQADLVARFLAEHQGPSPNTRNAASQNIEGFGITHLYTSLMIRSLDTVTPIAKALELTPVAWAESHENGGIFLHDHESHEPKGLPGNNRAFFEENYSNVVLPDHLNEGGWWNRPFERFEERVARGQKLVQDLIARHGGTDDRVAMVSHSGFYNFVMAAVLNQSISHSMPAWFVLNNTAITRIDFADDRTRIAYNNRADFLPPELVT